MKIQSEWNKTNITAVVQATGTGKSYIILKCLYDMAENNKLVLAPTNYILEQLAEYANDELPNTVLLTYSKLATMTNEQITEIKPSLIVLDEFHRCGAEIWGNSIQRLLNIHQFSKVLGTSATAVRYLDNSRDMGIELFKGNICVNMSLSEAIVRKILPMPKYISAMFTFKEEITKLREKVKKSRNEDNAKLELYKQIDKLKNELNKSKGIPEIFKKHLNLGIVKDGGKFIVFCKDKVHMEEMRPKVAGWFINAGVQNVKSYMVYSYYKDSSKDLSEFCNDESNNIKLLFSIDMLNEGLHIKGVTGVILLRPTTSPIIYYQQIGRALQVGNSTPLIFDFVNNFNNVGANIFINDLRNEAKRMSTDSNGSFEEECEEFTIFDEILDVKKLFSLIESMLVVNWETKYLLLKEYKEEFGHTVIPYEINKKPGKYKGLSTWASKQRMEYKKGLLENEKVERMNSIGFKWDIKDEQWSIMFGQLKEYNTEFGNVEVPSNVVDKYKSLSSWVKSQRTSARKGILSEERIHLLNSIGFSWTPNEVKWESFYNLLIEFREQYGHTLVPRVSKGKYEELGVWVGAQRYAFKNNLLRQDRIEKLNDIYFIWDSYEAHWEKMLLLLIEYKNKYGHVKVPGNSKGKYRELGRWVGYQRNNMRKNLLDKHKIKKLAELGLQWEPKSEQWNKMYSLLEEFKGEYGHIRVPYNINGKYKGLRWWINSQRYYYKNYSIETDRIRKLNEIGFIWDLNDQIWQDMYELLVEYKEKYDLTLVSKNSDPKYYPLIDWSIKQKVAFMDGTLDENKVDKLKLVNFSFFDKTEEKHYKAFKKIREVKDLLLSIKSGDKLVIIENGDRTEVGVVQRTKELIIVKNSVSPCPSAISIADIISHEIIIEEISQAI